MQIWECGISAPVRGPTPHAYQRVAARCGRQRLLEPPAAPKRGISEVKKTGNSRRLDLAQQSSLRELDWARAEGSHRGTPGRGTFFEFGCRCLLEQFRISRKRLGAGRFGAESNETLRLSIDLNNKFRRLQEAPKRYEKHARVQATASRYSPRLIAFLRALRGRHLESRQDRSLLPVRTKGWYAVQLFSSGNGMGRACWLVGFAARSWELDRCRTGQVDTRSCLRRLFQEVTAGNVLCVFNCCSVFLSQHKSHESTGMILKILRICDRNRLPWI